MEQKFELTSFLKDKKTDKAEFRRAQTIILLNKETETSLITEITGFRRRQAFELRKGYLSTGLAFLKTKRKGQPKQLLTTTQILEIENTVKDKSPFDFNYQTRFWTTAALADLIERRYGIKYKSRTSLYLIFKRIRFTYHKPGRVYEKRNEAEVVKWREETLPIIKAAFKDPETIILAEDEMILSSQTTLQKIWLPQGEYPKIEVSNTRRNLSIYGFLNLKTGGEHAFVTEKQTMWQTRRVLQKLRRIYPKEENRGNRLEGKKLLIIWDNPGWHRGSKVTDYIKKDGRIEVIYFPKYAPEENPQEHVWKEGRAKVTHSTFIGNLEKTAKDFVSYLNQTKFFYKLLGFSAIS